LADTNDSVTGGKPSDVSVNPLALFTKDVVQHINPAAWIRDDGTPGDGKWGDPESDNLVTRGRIFNEVSSKPFVDDFYRADDRWGAKPKYASGDDVAEVAATIGDAITSEPDLTDPNEGLDGYWERQAIQSGLRLIVGERLQLGNANGWNSDPTDGVTTGANDPLYPPNAKKSGLVSNTEIGGDHEHRQRRSLRDNLAAVQGMVVYHYQINGGEFPAACVALTSHPGTPQTIINSRTFDTYPNGDPKADFLNGQGTNGWEFYYPSNADVKAASDDAVTDGGFDTEAGFETQIASNKPLGIALRNLANFAGDPNGGAPSFKPVQDANIHPAPYFNMWGDYSGLRRIFTDYLDAASPVAYDDLSPADKATLHSAACTMSLLAYNLKGSLDEFAFVNATAVANLQILATALKTAAPTLSTPQTDPTNVNATPLPLSEWLAAAGATPANETAALTTWGQVNRDRTLGFRIGKAFTYTLDPAFAAVYTAGNYELTCNPDDFVGIPTTSATYVEDRLSLALAFCSAAESPKYPSLYYLFPVIASHGQKGTGDDAQPDGIAVTTQPAEEYITDSYVGTTNTSVSYLQVGTYGVNGVAEIAAVPRRATDLSDWVLPTGTASTGTLTNPDTQPFAIAIGSNIANVPFLDKALYDGREQLNTRVLDIDIEAITTRTTAGGDLWLPDEDSNGAEGVVFAFREDAVREDEIVRPKNASAVSCDTVDTGTYPRKFKVETDTNCRMKVLPDASSPVFQDPPLTADLVSIKPVDFISDPDRRTHGFRLRTLSGNPADFSGTGFARDSGMTFVTDNSVYILGNFNLHSTANTVASIIEEFTYTLKDNGVSVANFYDNRTKDNRNGDFANLQVDHWRPVEILADSVNILSGTFKDGAVSDSFSAIPGSRGGGTSSYMNQNRTRTALSDLVLENPDNANSPVWIDRNGTFYYGSTPQPFYDVLNADNEWTNFSERDDHYNNLQPAGETFVNGTFISGLVPKRPNQNNGGLHNFPRFLEDWDGDNLFITGSFIQLNFSTAATGQFDQDSWEQGENTSDDNNIYFYQPPNRRWGFDPALLYVPPAPAARRNVSIETPRDEYYRELASDDPYILNLRCAENADGDRVLPDVCPRP
jgi:hypothetical protein